MHSQPRLVISAAAEPVGVQEGIRGSRLPRPPESCGKHRMRFPSHLVGLSHCLLYGELIPQNPAPVQRVGKLGVWTTRTCVSGQCVPHRPHASLSVSAGVEVAITVAQVPATGRRFGFLARASPLRRGQGIGQLVCRHVSTASPCRDHDGSLRCGPVTGRGCIGSAWHPPPAEVGSRDCRVLLPCVTIATPRTAPVMVVITAGRAAVPTGRPRLHAPATCAA